MYVDPEIEQDSLTGGGRASLSRGISDGVESDASGGHWEWQVVSKDEYVDKYFEKNLNNQTKDHIYLGDIKIATVNNTDNPYYLLSDHLNSSSILTDSTGTVAQLSDYQPFGKINYDNELIDLKNDYTFTGKEYDEENLIYKTMKKYIDNELIDLKNDYTFTGKEYDEENLIYKTMKKYIYLVLGFILIATLPGAFNLLKPPIDDYSRGFDFGVILVHLLGFVFIFLYFKNARKERKKV